jgi:hypothetical protein
MFPSHEPCLSYILIRILKTSIGSMWISTFVLRVEFSMDCLLLIIVVPVGYG